MKNYSLSIRVIFALNAIVNLNASNSGDDALHASKGDGPVFLRKEGYREVNFKCPCHNKDTFPLIDPTPSIVDFYDGDQEAYSKLLLEKYPNNSCLWECTFHEDSSLVGTMKDDSLEQRLEHVIQDGLMHGKIVAMLPDLETLTGQRNAREKSRNWYASVFSCGRAQSKVPTLSAELLRSKVRDVRAQKYLELKDAKHGGGDQLSNFLDERNQFVEEMNGNRTNNKNGYYAVLDKNYKDLSQKVHTQEQVAILQDEINRYRLATAAVVGVAALAGAGLYVCSQKK